MPNEVQFDNKAVAYEKAEETSNAGVLTRPKVEIDVASAESVRRSKLDVESTPQPLPSSTFVNGYTVHPHARWCYVGKKSFTDSS
jgi:hypothetical protein